LPTLYTLNVYKQCTGNVYKQHIDIVYKQHIELEHCISVQEIGMHIQKQLHPGNTMALKHTYFSSVGQYL